MLGAHLFGLMNVSQAGLEPAVEVVTAAAAAAAHLFSQCNVAWRSFLQARASGCQSFDSSWCFISTQCGSVISTSFWSYGSHDAWFCTLVTILDPLPPLLQFSSGRNIHFSENRPVVLN
jgi:hypothetical protein